MPLFDPEISNETAFLTFAIVASVLTVSQGTQHQGCQCQGKSRRFREKVFLL